MGVEDVYIEERKEGVFLVVRNFDNSKCSAVLREAGSSYTRSPQASQQEIFLSTKKYKNVRERNRQVALVIDDLESIQP